MTDARRDTRGAQRRKTVAWAQLTLDGGETLRCVVMDESFTGARIKLPAPRTLKGPVKLASTASGAPRDAVVVWRRGDEAGLRFQSRKVAGGMLKAISARLGR
jgi:hypothetical protein